MLGTTYKVGFDAKEVRSGLSGLTGMMGRAMRQMGIGALRKVGEGAMDIFSRVLAYLPQSIKEMMDWAGNMTDMATQTNISMKDLMEFEEVLRLAGASAADTSMMISKFKVSLFEAANGSGEARDALNRLGIAANELDRNDIVGSFQKLAQAAKDAGLESGELDKIMMTLINGRMGPKFIRAMENMDESFTQARKNLGGFQDEADNLFPAFDAISDTLGRWTMIRRQLMASFVKGAFGEQAEDAESLSESIMNLIQRASWAMEELGKIVRPIFDAMQPVMQVLSELGPVEFFKKGMADSFAEIGRILGQGIKDGLGIDENSFFGKRLYGNPQEKKSEKTLFDLIQEAKNQTALLDRIHRDGTTAVFA
jgi:hypothetical protein